MHQLTDRARSRSRDRNPAASNSATPHHVAGIRQIRRWTHLHRTSLHGRRPRGTIQSSTQDPTCSQAQSHPGRAVTPFRKPDTYRLQPRAVYRAGWRGLLYDDGYI
jgi:hypothetical protein